MIRVGCCGFPVRRELYYQSFPVVEIQQTFYQPPRLETGRRWREEAPADFEFTMKAWQLITHEASSPTYRRLRMELPEKTRGNYGFFKPTDEVEEAWHRTAEFAEVLQAKKVIFQSPASFLPSEVSVKHLKDFFQKRRRDPFTFIWEPRGKWRRSEVERLCREMKVVPCLDPFEGSPPKGDLLYVRLHGRRGYRDRYSIEEMQELLKKGRAYRHAYFMFNNVAMYEDAGRMKSLLGAGG